MFKIKSLLTIMAVLVSSSAFAGGATSYTPKSEVRDFGSTAPFDNGFQGTRLFSDGTSGLDITAALSESSKQVTGTNPSSTYLGLGLDYKFVNGIYVGTRLGGNIDSDAEIGYIGYTNTLMNNSNPFWVQVGASRVHQSDYVHSTNSRDTTLEIGTEQRFDRARVGGFLAYEHGATAASNGHATRYGVYGELPVDIQPAGLLSDWKVTGQLSRVDAPNDTKFNEYKLGFGKVWNSGLGFELSYSKANLDLFKGITSANLSYQF
jgi:hypothetical protein